ncbi:hypothetical protein CAPN001_13770 [Capnocytophaga stomatis]|uniref:DUF6261 family protein n=1 Tax=Capnocytophaga stomatis TaxID=1848904 RepID=UPI0019511AE7|nr:DUF6261 family protein [Capnocytophaga stomatis]GIJ96808.1 hypothetical protein CAPN001_13770 [Capnocytophaga stomatis]
MKKLFTISKTTEIGDVSERLVVLFKKETSFADDTFLVSLFEEIETLSEQIIEAIKRDVIVSKLEEVDNARGKMIRSLNNILKGYQSMPIPKLKEAGEKLYKVFSKYGVSITRESYANQSSLTESLLQDFSATELESDISTLVGVSECISELRNAQKNFNEMRLEYEKTLVAQSQKPTASELKKVLINVINGKLVPYLIAMQLVNVNKYGSFSATVAQIIEDNNAAVKRRSGARDKRKNSKDSNSKEQ